MENFLGEKKTYTPHIYLKNRGDRGPTGELENKGFQGMGPCGP